MTDGEAKRVPLSAIIQPVAHGSSGSCLRRAGLGRAVPWWGGGGAKVLVQAAKTGQLSMPTALCPRRGHFGGERAEGEAALGPKSRQQTERPIDRGRSPCFDAGSTLLDSILNPLVLLCVPALRG